MKKRNLFTIIAVVAVLIASSIGIVFAAMGGNPQTTTGEIQFTAPSGIRWNMGIGAFEVFSAAGMSYIGSNQYANLTGDIAINQADAYHEVMDTNHTYFIMKDLDFTDKTNFYSNYATTFKDFGTSGNTSGMIDGGGHTITGLTYRTETNSFLFQNVYGYIRNLNIQLSASITNTAVTGGVVCNNLYGTLHNVTVTGSLTLNASSGTGYIGVFTDTVTNYGRLNNCKNTISLTATKYYVAAFYLGSSNATAPLANCTYNVNTKTGTANDTLATT